MTRANSGTTSAAQIYAPHGASRYSSGTMPTDHGYTGQRADTATGLDYYGARYYDPQGGQFASADTVADGLNRYGYVGGNPTTATDPSGHAQVLDGGGGDTIYLDCGEGNYSGCPTASTGSGGGGPACGGARQCSPAGTCVGTSTQCPPTQIGPQTGPIKPIPCGQLICGLRDRGKLAAGLAIVAGGVAVFIAALAGLIWSFTNPLAKLAIGLAQTAVQQAAGGIAQFISQGLQLILGAFDYVNPWVRVIVDVFALLSDIAAMAISFLVGFNAVLQRGRAAMTLAQKWSLVMNGIINHTSEASVFALTNSALAASAVGIFTGFGSFVNDAFRLRDDLGTAFQAN